MKKTLKISFYIVFLFLICVYLGSVFILPKIFNSKIVADKLQSLIYDKTKMEMHISGQNLKVSPKLVFDFTVDSIDAKYSNAVVIDIKNLSLNYKFLQNYLTLVKAKNIYVDGNNLKQFIKSPKEKKKKHKFELKKHPEIHIQNLTFKSDNISIFAQNLDTENDIIKITASVTTPYLSKTLKLGTSGSLKVEENKLQANKFGLQLGNSNLYLKGLLIDNNKSYNFDLQGEHLPVSELMPILLHFQKSQDPAKKFIENFKDYKGTVDVALKFKNDGIWGECVANNLSANAVWFNIPLFFRKAVFYFNGKEVDSNAEGILGNEKVIHTLKITDLGSEKKAVIGKMKTTLTKKFNFIPNFVILNSVNADLVYKIKSKKPDVYYNLDVPVNSDLIYNTSYLGLRKYNRKIYANTFKNGNDLYLKEYKYSYFDSDKENIVIFGDGLFVKINDKFTPQYLTCHTNGYAPISVTGSFGEKIKGGKFSGDLKYDFTNNKVFGTFDIINARYKAFFVEKAHVNAKSDLLNVSAKGLFKGENYSAELSAKNNIYGETLVYNLKLFLDKLVFETTSDTHKKNKKINSKEFSKKVRNADITINNWEIFINEIKRESFVLQDVKLLGSLKNHIFDFNMSELNFADGIVSASGIYNFAKNTSDMVFTAKNINSNKAAEMMLNLKNQVEGTANAKVKLEAKEMFKYLDVHCDFEIKEGFLPKLGDTEFMIKNSKYKLSDVINVDLTQKELMQDDIKGSFDVHNSELKNINMTTWHELSAMFLEGNYEMKKQYADLQLFWKYNKEIQKNIKIFGIPFSLILKIAFRPENSKEIYKSELSKVPEIKADENNTSYYRVKLKGDINNNKFDLILREIK